MTLIKPFDPGKYIDDLFTRGLEYAVRNNMKEFVESDNVVCGGDEIDMKALMFIPPKYEFVPEAIPTKYHVDLDSGFISGLFKSPRYNFMSNQN